ncbi:hypothetical protein HPB47_024005 [Ixodes persulcatus]|uniref:Uncharacterized protein n=1 Tax=Ixodes persulcatus TaxID=34615 RepID=A0AC60Q5S5_IXOPE|nr:hypothetical protein HPB47_024005 [Ixodes persulcatus]
MFSFSSTQGLRTDDEQDSPCTGRLGVDFATSVALLRDLLADTLNGISFLTDQMTAVREENARLRSELTRSSEIQSVMLRNIQTELRDLRHRPRAAFVTRLDTNCSLADVREHLGQFFGPRELRCTELKTRYGGYSSFHFAAVDDDIEALFDLYIWPEGCLFREFQGRLTESRVHFEKECIE